MSVETSQPAENPVKLNRLGQPHLGIIRETREWMGAALTIFTTLGGTIDDGSQNEGPHKDLSLNKMTPKQQEEWFAWNDAFNRVRAKACYLMDKIGL